MTVGTIMPLSEKLGPPHPPRRWPERRQGAASHCPDNADPADSGQSVAGPQHLRLGFAYMIPRLVIPGVGGLV